LATNQIAQTGLSSLPPVIYYSEQLFREFWEALRSLPSSRLFDVHTRGRSLARADSRDEPTLQVAAILAVN
uniref:hypothetical protein n=2 Tax=unclassified Aeromonas TaxID=257493 RepID=UPI0022E1A893